MSLRVSLTHLDRWLAFFIKFPRHYRCSQTIKPLIIERLDRKLMSRGLISYRRLVVSCSKMELDGSIIVEICDETMPKRKRKPVEMQGLFACMLFFFGVFSAAFISGVCFYLRLLSYCDGDPSKPLLNLQGKHLLLLFCVICPCFWENASQIWTLPEPYLVD